MSRPLLKKAFMAMDPVSAGAAGGVTAGYTGGRGTAGAVANIASKRGYKTKNEELARNLAMGTTILGSLAGIGLGYKHKEKLVRLLRKGFGADPDLERLYPMVLPFAAGATGGVAAGGATGAATSLRGRFSSEKKASAFWDGFEKSSAIKDWFRGMGVPVSVKHELGPDAAAAVKKLTPQNIFLGALLAGSGAGIGYHIPKRLIEKKEDQKKVAAQEPYSEKKTRERPLSPHLTRIKRNRIEPMKPPKPPRVRPTTGPNYG